MEMVKIKCTYCNKEFERYKGEIKRAEKKGWNSFCSTSCSCSYYNKKTPRMKGRTCSPKRAKSFGKYSERDKFTQFRYFLYQAKARDKRKNRLESMDLTLEYLRDLWDKQKGICKISGRKMILPDSSAGWNSGKTVNNASLDRIDSNIGYQKGNVHYICYIANLGKHTFTEKDLVKFCCDVAKQNIRG